jgi:hypothetical protein
MSKSDTVGAGAAAGAGGLGSVGTAALLFDAGWLPEHALKVKILAMASQHSAVPDITPVLIRLRFLPVI